MLQTRNSLDPIESTNISHSSPKLDAISIPFTSLHFLVATLEVLKQGEAITREKSRGTSQSQHPPKNTNLSHLYLGPDTNKRLFNGQTVDTFRGTQKGPVTKKTQKLNATSKVIHFRPQNAEASSRNVAVLLVRWWCTSYILDNPTCLEPSSHWATHSFETGHCYCWSKSKECPTNINTRWRHVPILWTRHPQGLKNLLNLKSHCETYIQIIPNTLFIVHIQWNNLKQIIVSTRHAVLSHLKNRIS